MGKKVLIVDDNAQNLYILQTLLTGHGMDVISAVNGQEALDAAKVSPPDLIVSDILMPVMDGYTLIKTWKEDEALRSIPFIFYTATYTDAKDEAFALKLGANRFIIKPQEPHVIVGVIEECLQHQPPVAQSSSGPLGSEMEFFRQHNAVLFQKLEKKMLDLKQANERLNREIEERKKAEEKLVKITQAIEESPVAILLTDTEGNMEYANPKFSQISGYALTDIEHLNVSILKSGDIPPQVYRDLWHTVRQGQIWRGELCNQRKDGEKFWAYLSLSPMLNAQGQITHYLAMMEDVSEKRKLEEQLRQAQKLEGIGQLAGGVAHDFNNILTAIIGYAYIAYLNMQKEDPLRGHLKQVLDYSEKAAAITKSLLAFSRKQSTRPSRHNLNALLSNIHEFLRRFLPENIDIQIHCAPEALPVFVDSVQMEQVFMNLATNARDAMSPAGGRFVLSTRLLEISDEFLKTHGYGKPGAFAEITVSDTGCGMDLRTREKIFEPFFTTKEQGKGSGLGLAIVYGIIQQHNGYISVYAEPGQGTMFRILLPIVSDTANREFKKPPAAVKGGTETLLVAEDDDGIRDLMTTIFRERGYTVIPAADGDEAVQMFAQNRERISLVVLDGIMPKKNGAQVFKEISASRPEIKVLFLSGYSENMIDLKSLEISDVHFLQKPALPSDILKKVRDMLDQTPPAR